MLTKTVAAGVFLLLVSLPVIAVAAKYKAAANEVVLLPRFCWAQYMDDVKGPEYEIPRSSCGVFMNHYCPALLEVIRANRSFGNPGVRKQHLTIAKRETIYTLNGMKEFPTCPIRAHAESTLRQMESALKGFDK